ncbi:MAG: 4Fe-4S binding protein [Magnetococcales bacterium]|nr:4Fe-4S binding protein [Magnetococcales bacterium]MBF0155953.1 4Fe-4S binding protein [Magnetococcales bacterium]
MITLRTIRRYWALTFLGLFFFLLVVADFRGLKGYAVSLFLEMDPLTALAGLLTSGTLYRGLAWSLVVVIPTLFFGRFFCSWVCPLGILNQIVGRSLNRRRPGEEYRLNRYRPLFRTKYYILAALLVLAAGGTLQTGLLDPLALLTRSVAVSLFPALDFAGLRLYLHHPVFQGGILIALLLLAILWANRLFPRFWCRVLCPLGALLGLLSWRALFRIRRDVDRCSGCGRCLTSCQGGCDPDGELRVSECHLCMNCLEECPEGALHFGLPGSRSSVHQPWDINRRRLVESGVAALAGYPLWKSSLSAESRPAPSVIRPPGSLPESAFLARCLKCGACMRVCPTQVLQPAMLESGLEGLWTPILVYRLGYCEHHCVLCGQVCPTGAIRRIGVGEKIGIKPKEKPIRLGTAFFDRGRCLPWSMQTPCIVCEEMCPTSPKAIWYETVTRKHREGGEVTLKRPFVEPDRCIGCGICENKCPVPDLAAIRVTSVGESRSETNRMILKNG